MHTHRLLLALLLLVLAVGCGGGPGGEGQGKEGEEDEFKPDPRTLVEALPADVGGVGQYVVSSATVESEAEVDLVPETNGIVTAVRAEEGDSVRRGQVLATIENPNLDAGFERAKAELERAEQSYDELRRLSEVGAVSERDLLDAHHALVTARASFDEARATKAFTHLVSPIDGTVAVRDIRFGQTASAAARAFQVVDLDRLRVVVQLPERDLARVALGQPALLVPVYDSQLEVAAQVARISPVVEPNSGTFRVTVVPQAPDRLLRPGQFVSVRVQVDHHDQALTIPRRAVLYDRGAPYVFRVEQAPPELKKGEEGDKEEEEEGEEGDGEEEEEEEPGFWEQVQAKLTELKGKGEGEEEEEKEDEPPGPKRVARKLPIEVGFVEVEIVEVIGGLEEGDLVVTLGHEALRDEARVRLPSDPEWHPGQEDDEDEEDASAEGDEQSAEGSEGEEE